MLVKHIECGLAGWRTASIGNHVNRNDNDCSDDDANADDINSCVAREHRTEACSSEIEKASERRGGEEESVRRMGWSVSAVCLWKVITAAITSTTLGLRAIGNFI